MKKLNSDIIIKILILLCFAIFYFRIIKNNVCTSENHSIFNFGNDSNVYGCNISNYRQPPHQKKKIRFKNYVLFIIPLIMIFLMQSISANSSIKTDDINTKSNGLSNTNLTYDNSEVDLSDKKTESDRQDEKKIFPYTVEVLKKIMFICKKIDCAIFS